MEFSQGLAAVKQTALRNIAPADAGDISRPIIAHPADVGGPRTPLHRDHQIAGQIVDDASVSIPGRVTAHAIGGTSTLLWARLLGVEYERLFDGSVRGHRSSRRFQLNEAEQADFAQRAVEVPTTEWLQASGPSV